MRIQAASMLGIRSKLRDSFVLAGAFPLTPTLTFQLYYWLTRFL